MNSGGGVMAMATWKASVWAVAIWTIADLMVVVQGSFID